MPFILLETETISQLGVLDMRWYEDTRWTGCSDAITLGNPAMHVANDSLHAWLTASRGVPTCCSSSGKALILTSWHSGSGYTDSFSCTVLVENWPSQLRSMIGGIAKCCHGTCARHGTRPYICLAMSYLAWNNGIEGGAEEALWLRAHYAGWCGHTRGCITVPADRDELHLLHFGRNKSSFEK